MSNTPYARNNLQKAARLSKCAFAAVFLFYRVAFSFKVDHLLFLNIRQNDNRHLGMANII